MVALAEKTIKEVSSEVKSLRVRPAKLVEECLRRIDELNDALKMFIYVARDEAMRCAEKLEGELEEGLHRSVIHGLPIAVKDVFYTMDMPTTAGSTILKDFKPPKDAEVVRRLRGAGAIIIGKTNMHEFAFGVTNKNPHYGVTRNPWSMDRISGGSSGGSAVAVSVGVCMGALGTDTAGSIRIPSALCGVVGYKPTYGLVSLDGVIPLSWSLDTAGPIARTVEDAAVLLDIITNGNLNKATTGGGDREWRLGLPRKIIEELVSKDVEEVFWKSIDKLTSKLSCKLIDIDADWLKPLSDARYVIVLSEAATFHLKWLKRKWDMYDPDVGRRILGGLFIPATVYIKAQRIREALGKRFWREAEELDGVLLPTVPIEAPKVEDEEVIVKSSRISVRQALLSLTEVFNSLGSPAISIPCGLTRNNLPVGLQIATRPGEDRQLFLMAKSFEKVLGRLPVPPILNRAGNEYDQGGIS